MCCLDHIQDCKIIRYNRLTVGINERKLVLQSEHGTWRFFIESTELLYVEIEQIDPSGNVYKKTDWVAPQGAIETLGRGQVNIYVTQIAEYVATSNAVVSVYMCEKIDTIDNVYYYDIEQQSLNGANVIVGSFNGSPAPFTRYMRIYASQSLRVLGRNRITGNYTYLSGSRSVNEVTFEDLLVSPVMQWEIRQDVASPTIPLYFSVVWIKNYN